MLKISWGDKVT